MNGTIFRGGLLIDGSGAKPTENASMIVEKNRIVAIGGADLACPDGFCEVNLNGKTIMPGMIDCHDHLANLEGGLGTKMFTPPSLAVFLAADSFKRTLLGGFTSIRDAGGVDLGMKLAVDRGLIPGPRLKISIVILSQFGGHNDHTEASGTSTDIPWLQGIPDPICDGRDGCRRKVREVIRAGADWVKIATTGGVGTPIGGPLVRQFSFEEVEAICDTAHAAGKPVGSHAYGGEGVKICLDAGVDVIEHGAVLEDALIEQMVRQGTWVVPTFTVLRRILDIAEKNPSALPEYMPRKARTLLESQVESLQKCLRAGVPMALGTDGGGFGHGHNADELKYLVAAGLNPLQVLNMATHQGAKCMGIGDEVGLLKAGYLADFLVVDQNPLEDLTILENADSLCMIVKDGIIYKDQLAKMS